MNYGPGDTISVAADTLNLPAPQAEYSIGRIIPFISSSADSVSAGKNVYGLSADYTTGIKLINGDLRPPEIINTDLGFILLSFALLFIAILYVFARKSMISGLLSISFRKHIAITPPGTSEVLSWPPIFRNIFTILNLSLFAAIAFLTMGLISPGLFGGSAGLTGVLAGAFLAALLLRHLTCIIIAGITGFQSLFRDYMSIVYNTWFACSLFLFILNLIILFAPIENPVPFLISGFMITSLFLIIRALRLLVIFTDRHISVIYFILYLCVLEVLPVLVTLKIIGVF